MTKPLTDSERIEVFPPEYWVKKAKEGENMAVCWQGIYEWIELEYKKESYEQGFKDACEKWEKILVQYQFHHIGQAILSLAEKEGFVGHNK